MGKPEGPPELTTVETIVVYWLEEEKQCNGKRTLLGVSKTARKTERGKRRVGLKSRFTWIKGELASSTYLQKSDLPFDTARTSVDQMPMLVILNELFAAAGENFVGHEVWRTNTPVILRNVVVGRSSPTNLSIARRGPGTAVFPCTEFSVFSQGRAQVR